MYASGIREYYVDLVDFAQVVTAGPHSQEPYPKGLLLVCDKIQHLFSVQTKKER